MQDKAASFFFLSPSSYLSDGTVNEIYVMDTMIFVFFALLWIHLLIA